MDAPADVVEVDSGLARLREYSRERFFLFLHVVLDILREHRDFRVVERAVGLLSLDVGDEQLDAVVFHLRLVQHRVLDLLVPAGGIENLLLDHAVKDQLVTGLAGELPFLVLALPFGLELPEQPLDLAMVRPKQRLRVLRGVHSAFGGPAFGSLLPAVRLAAGAPGHAGRQLIGAGRFLSAFLAALGHNSPPYRVEMCDSRKT